MKARSVLTAALAVLIALVSLATNSLAQDYVANVFPFGHSGQFK